MKILITGYTGFVGKNLVSRLKTQGHELILLGRDLHLPDNIFGLQAVIHLAGENIAGGIWTKKRKQKLMSSRIETTRFLINQLVERGAVPSVFISASAIGYYGDRGDEWCRETDNKGAGFLSDVVDSWENAVQEISHCGSRICKLRFGMILGREGALKKMLPAFRFGVGAVLGSGKQWNSWIHIEDAVGIIQHVLENTSCEGTYNSCAPNPVSQKDFAQGLARSLNRPCYFRVPASIIKLALGGFSELILHSQRVNVEKLIKSGYQFRYAEFETALARCKS